MELNILALCYLLGSISFISGLKMLSNPATARKGNLLAAVGMVIAIFGTIFLYQENGAKLGNYTWIFGGLLIGTVVGTLMAKRVKMTAMPEMVSLFNGMGGACAALISIIEFRHLVHVDPVEYALGGYQFYSSLDGTKLLIILLGLIIGAVSFSGSMIAWGKLNGKIKDFSFKGQHIANLVIFGFNVLLAAFIIVARPEETPLFFYVIVFLSILYGVFFVLPLGGADMPVVISYSIHLLG